IKEKIVPEMKPIAKLVEVEEVAIEELVPQPQVEEEEIIEEVEVVEVKKPKKFKIPTFSEEMPEDQMEWNSMLETDLVNKDWSGEGYVAGKEDKQEEDSLSFHGDIIKIKMKFAKRAKISQILSIYKFGAEVHDDNGKSRGYKIQKVGIVEVIEVHKRQVKAVVVQANSSIMKGMIVKK
ncbi:MAG: hypothetical protein U9Q34_06690, partial [Elusimicrobiota bacterium]|nr:hypothetical protein [Elusimicrobiota bacterium]